MLCDEIDSEVCGAGGWFQILFTHLWKLQKHREETEMTLSSPGRGNHC